MILKVTRNQDFTLSLEDKFFESYVTYNNKNAANLGKLFFYHKGAFNVPGRPVISKCETLTEKVSEYLCKATGPMLKA